MLQLGELQPREFNGFPRILGMDFDSALERIEQMARAVRHRPEETHAIYRFQFPLPSNARSVRATLTCINRLWEFWIWLAPNSLEPSPDIARCLLRPSFTAQS